MKATIRDTPSAHSVLNCCDRRKRDVFIRIPCGNEWKRYDAWFREDRPFLWRKYLYAVHRSPSKYKKKENRGIKYSGSQRADERKRNRDICRTCTLYYQSGKYRKTGDISDRDGFSRGRIRENRSNGIRDARSPSGFPCGRGRRSRYRADHQRTGYGNETGYESEDCLGDNGRKRKRDRSFFRRT